MRHVHPDTVTGLEAVRRQDKIQSELVTQQFKYGMSMAAPKSQQTLTFKLTIEQRQKSAQAMWYIYSAMKISKRGFESSDFRAMVKQFADKAECHVLSVKSLSRWVYAEFEVFLLFLR